MILLLETLFPLGFHPPGGARGGQRHSALEIECGNLFCLLGQGGHGLQHLHAGLPLESCRHFTASICAGDGGAQCDRAAILFPPRRSLLRAATETEVRAGLGQV